MSRYVIVFPRPPSQFEIYLSLPSRHMLLLLRPDAERIPNIHFESVSDFRGAFAMGLVVFPNSIKSSNALISKELNLYSCTLPSPSYGHD